MVGVGGVTGALSYTICSQFPVSTCCHWMETLTFKWRHWKLLSPLVTESRIQESAQESQDDTKAKCNTAQSAITIKSVELHPGYTGHWLLGHLCIEWRRRAVTKPGQDRSDRFLICGYKTRMFIYTDSKQRSWKKHGFSMAMAPEFYLLRVLDSF